MPVTANVLWAKHSEAKKVRDANATIQILTGFFLLSLLVKSRTEIGIHFPSVGPGLKIEIKYQKIKEISFLGEL